MKRYSRQQLKKLQDGKCFLCAEERYEVLAAHRIVEGGTYHRQNVLTLCANCHNIMHRGNIKVDRKYFSTKGRWIVHMWVDGKEYWVDESVGFKADPPVAESSPSQSPAVEN